MRYLLSLAIFMASPLLAEPPKIVTTIAPLYGIASDMMRGIATPETIVPQGADLHHFSLKPSSIAALLDADIIFAVGAGMEPWLNRIAPQITGKIIYLADLSAPESRLPRRELTEFGASPAAQNPETFDPHMWLDSSHGLIWSMQIAQELVEIDPDNASQYEENARALIQSLAPALAQVQTIANQLGQAKLIVTHDSLQYFANEYQLNVVGALTSISDEAAGPRVLSQFTNMIGDICILVDINEDHQNAAVLFPNSRQSDFDPQGFEFAGQPDYLANLYLSLASALENCITDP